MACNKEAFMNTIPFQTYPTHAIQPLGVSEAQVLGWANAILNARFDRSNYLVSPNHTRDYLQVMLAPYPREVFGIIALDSQHAVLSLEILFQGTIDAAAVYPRDIVKAALAHNAAAVILTHNHPSGCPEPSEADCRVTQRIVSALATVDIRVLDHLIVGGTQTISFAERGLLPSSFNSV